MPAQVFSFTPVVLTGLSMLGPDPPVIEPTTPGTLYLEGSLHIIVIPVF